MAAMEMKAMPTPAHMLLYESMELLSVRLRVIAVIEP